MVAGIAYRSALRLPAARRAAAPNFARCYATAPSEFSVADAKGVKVAAHDNGAPTSAITVVVKSGSRYETSPGLAHALRASLFKATNKRSHIRLVRETEILGGVLSSSLTREHLILTAEFMKGDEGFFAEVLGDALTEAKLSQHEYNEETIPGLIGEYEQAMQDPYTQSFDVAHQLAFRTGLGNSLYASPHDAISFKQTVEYAHAAANPSNITVVGSGVDGSYLQSLVGDFFVSGTSAGTLSSSPAKYFGGETRLRGHGHSTDHYLLAFKGAQMTDADHTVLRYLLGGESSVKWSPGSNPLAKLNVNGATAQAFNFGYSDAGLFGVIMSAPEGQTEALASKVVAELKAIAKGVSKEALQQAINKAKFAAATSLEANSGRLEVVGTQIAVSGKTSKIEDVLAKYDKVTVDSVTKAAAAALKTKATSVAIGSNSIPYADDLGL